VIESGQTLRREHYLDLALVTAVATIGAVWAASGVRTLLPLRAGFGASLGLFVPGYAAVSALFPDTGATEDGGPSTAVRLVLSVALSAVLVPLLALALQYSEVGIRRTPVAVGLLGITLAFVGLALYRRKQVRPESRFTFAPVAARPAILDRAGRSLTRGDRLLYGVLLVAIVTAASGVGYSLVSPTESGTTEFYLLAEDRTGELSGNDYPTDLIVGEPTPLAVTIENREGESRMYTVTVELQEVTERSADADVLRSSSVTTYSTRVGSDETSTREIDVVPEAAGTERRLLFSLYVGSDTDATPYRTVYLWVDVRRSGQG
jgi:uncharacterized membrane protein